MAVKRVDTPRKKKKDPTPEELTQRKIRILSTLGADKARRDTAKTVAVELKNRKKRKK